MQVRESGPTQPFGARADNAGMKTNLAAWDGQRRERYLLFALFIASFVLGNAIALAVLL